VPSAARVSTAPRVARMGRQSDTMGVLALVAVLSLLGCVQSSEKTNKYADNEIVTLWVNKVGPYNNPTETYNYFYLPYCKARPEKKDERRWAGLGEALQGNELINSNIDVRFKGGVGGCGFSPPHRGSWVWLHGPRFLLPANPACAQWRRARPALQSPSRTPPSARSSSRRRMRLSLTLPSGGTTGAQQLRRAATQAPLRAHASPAPTKTAAAARGRQCTGAVLCCHTRCRRYELFMDDLPMWGFVGELAAGVGKEQQALIYTHKQLNISYNNDRVSRACAARTQDA